MSKLIDGLRHDSRDYGRHKGHGRPVEPGELLVWAQREKRAWQAAEKLEAKREEVARLEARIAELKADADEYHQLISRQGDLLRGAVNALRGDPPPLTWWSVHDVAELAAAMRTERDALAAVIEQALAPENIDFGHMDVAIERVRDVLAAADTDAALREVRAKVRELPVTDAEVEAAAGAMPCRWSPRDHEHPVGDDCRAERMGCLTVARRALEAAAAIREARS